MLALTVLAAALLFFAAFCFFGAPYLMFGRAALAGMAQRADARFAAGALATLVIALALSPLAVAALISGHDQAQVFAENISGLSFGM